MALWERVFAKEIAAEKARLKELEDDLSAKISENEQLRIQLRESIDKLHEHYNKSLDYRRMLQKYRSELIARTEELDQRETELEDRIASIVDIAAEKVRKEKEAAESATEKMKLQEQSLYRAEHAVRGWIRRREQSEIAIYEEIAENIEKFREVGAKFVLMDGFKFEEYVAEQLKANGFTNVVVTQKGHDFGADVLAEMSGVKYGFQCKYYSSPVGIDAIQQINAAQDYYHFHVPVVVTNTTFTVAAKAQAEASHIVLWDYKKIEEWESKN